MNCPRCVEHKCLISKMHVTKVNAGQSARISKRSPLAAEWISSHNSTSNRTLSPVQILVVLGKPFWTLYKSKHIFLLSTVVLARL